MVQVIKQVGEKRYRETFGRHYEEFTDRRHLRTPPGTHHYRNRQHVVHAVDDEHAPDAFRR